MLTVKADHFAFYFLHVIAVMAFNQAGGTERQLQAGGFKHQTGSTGQTSVTAQRRGSLHALFGIIERFKQAAETGGHQRSPGAARRHSSCQRVASEASMSPSSALTLQPPAWIWLSASRRQPCRLKVTPNCCSTRSKSAGLTRSCGFPLNMGSCEISC